MTAVRFEVPRLPVPCPRPRVTRKRTYMPKRYTDWVRGVRAEAFIAMAVRRLPLNTTGDMRLTITVYAAARRGDWDNIGKGISDALQGAVYADDKQVRAASVTLLDGPKKDRRTVIEVEQL